MCVLFVEIPSVSVNPVNLTVTENEMVKFLCGYEDTRPSPTIFKWRFVDKQGSVKIYNRTTVPSDRQSGLDISSATRSDAGMYACIVGNEFGTTVSSVATLTVRCEY